MKRLFLATLGLGMIANVAAASAQGYPFAAADTDQPWSVNQEATGQRLGSGGGDSHLWSVKQIITDPRRDAAAPSRAFLVAPERRDPAAR